MKVTFTLHFWVLLLSLNFIEANQDFKQTTESTHNVLIVGCGRSGTEFMSIFLRASGYDVTHEKLGNDGCIAWPMVADYYSPWEPRGDKSTFRHIFHQVRNPLHVITSWMTNLYDLERDEWVFIRKNIPEIHPYDSLIVHCAKYWYYWNLKAEEISEWRYKIEDLKYVLPEFQERLGFKLDQNILETMPNNINSWTPITQKIYWSYLELVLPENLFLNLQKMAAKYGYPISD